MISSPVWANGDHVETLDDLVDQFMEVRGVVESHALLKTKVVVLRDPAPWINVIIIDGRHKLRKAERIWRLPTFRATTIRTSCLLPSMKNFYTG
jgi:hypothetical protein